MRNYNRRGSIGITIVMLVFCLLMSVSMSYQKTIQTETIIQNNVNYSDRAMDAAFSGVNYAMAVIQSNKKVFARSVCDPDIANYIIVHSLPPFLILQLLSTGIIINDNISGTYQSVLMQMMMQVIHCRCSFCFFLPFGRIFT